MREVEEILSKKKHMVDLFQKEKQKYLSKIHAKESILIEIEALNESKADEIRNKILKCER